MQLFLGIDGGQSSTVALIGDEHGRVIGSAKGGPCNHVSAGEAATKFRSVIHACVSEACRAAGLHAETTRFRSACCGMSGGPHDKAAHLAQILPTEKLIVLTDGETALVGAMSGKPGIVVIAGTGSIAYGRGPHGNVKRAGGWGHLFGDEGSAYDIARHAIRATLRYEEGWGQATTLHPILLEAICAQDANNMLHRLYDSDWPRARIAQLAPLVDSVAADGDSIARGILEQAGQNLALLSASLQTMLFSEGDPIRVAPIGGVFRSQIVRNRFQALTELRERCECVAPDLDPTAGALLEAYRQAGRRVTLSQVPLLK